MKKETAAALLYSATALTFIGVSQPAVALPPFPGQPTATNTYETPVDVGLCQTTGANGWLPPGAPTSPTGTGFGAGVDISYGPPSQVYYWVDQCYFFTDLNSCNAAASAAENDAQLIYNWYVTNKYPRVTLWMDNAITSGSYCNNMFPPTGGTGSTSGGQWTIVNRGTSYLDLMTPNNTVYKEDSYTNFVTCQAGKTDLYNVCNNTKGCNGNIVDKGVCPGG